MMDTRDNLGFLLERYEESVVSNFLRDDPGRRGGLRREPTRRRHPGPRRHRTSRSSIRGRQFDTAARNPNGTSGSGGTSLSYGPVRVTADLPWAATLAWSSVTR